MSRRGVDSDQDHLASGRVLTGMMKRVDSAVFDVCQRVAQGRFRSGTIVYGVREKGVGLSRMRFMRNDVPLKAMATARKLEQVIAQGALKPPYDEATFRQFKPPRM
ncbi:MAG: BMP family ABC transporter substrate-binding protein [Fimbriimonadales bacterium]|nr:BMP family ABC transporter substrate-binding protein [Fimbriimonadales bacterium]